MVKSFKYLFLICVLQALTACALLSQQPADPQTLHGLLWKIEHPGVAPSYLFGTIHSEDKRVIDLPPIVRQAFDKSTSLALEIEFTPQTGQYAFASMFFSDGKTLGQVAGSDIEQRATDIMSKRGLSAQQVSMMKPWAVFTLMNMPESETGVYLDVKLFQLAAQQGKGLHGLETIEEQISTFDAMPMGDQLALLRYSLENEEQFDAIMDQTIDIYLSRDLGAMENLNNEFMAEMSPELAKRFVTRLIDNRNNRMFQRMQPLLDRGGAFIAVGALHLPGKAGLINQLRTAGMQVSAVY